MTEVLSDETIPSLPATNASATAYESRQSTFGLDTSRARQPMPARRLMSRDYAPKGRFFWLSRQPMPARRLMSRDTPNLAAPHTANEQPMPARRLMSRDRDME